MSAVQACKGCGGLFAFLPRGLCAECIDRREERFQTVRDWLQDNRGASILAASQATGVEEGLIAEFIRAGRLEFTGGSAASEELRSREAELRARIASQIAAAEALSSDGSAPAPSTGHAGMKSRLS